MCEFIVASFLRSFMILTFRELEPIGLSGQPAAMRASRLQILLVSSKSVFAMFKLLTLMDTDMTKLLLSRHRHQW